jgi:hypothetical protein
MLNKNTISVIYHFFIMFLDGYEIIFIEEGREMDRVAEN